MFRLIRQLLFTWVQLHGSYILSKVRKIRIQCWQQLTKNYLHFFDLILQIITGLYTIDESMHIAGSKNRNISLNILLAILKKFMIKRLQSL